MAIPKWLVEVAADPAEFRRALTIDAGGEERKLADVCDDWQTEDYEALDSGWRAVVGRSVLRPTLRAYLERPRGHDKTTGIATMATWALLASPRKLTGVAAACDKDQARLIRDAVETLVQNNPWLGAFIRVHNYQIRNPITGSTLEIVATDAAGNFGKLLDFLIIDELTHWAHDAHQTNWEALFSAVAKRQTCMLVVISNAGVGQGTGWQWAVREAARTSDRWYFRRLDGVVASWITKEDLQEQRELLPASAYKRLWLNLWVPGTGDALSVDDVEAAMTLSGPRNYVDDGWTHLLGLDLGVKHDHSALAVVACKPGTGRVKLANIVSWKPMPGGQVNLQLVRDMVHRAFQDYRSPVCFFDPHQCALMAQELTAEGCNMVPVEFVGKNLTSMASSVLQAFSGRKIDLYADPDLKRDLLRLMIVEKPYGYKLEAISDEHGHADRAIALALALPGALSTSETGMMPDDGLGDNLLNAVGAGV